MLWSEPAGETAIDRGMTDNSQYTAHPNIIRGRFGQNVYSSIHLFVTIRVNKAQHFVEAWYAMSQPQSFMRRHANQSQRYQQLW